MKKKNYTLGAVITYIDDCVADHSDGSAVTKLWYGGLTNIPESRSVSA